MSVENSVKSKKLERLLGKNPAEPSISWFDRFNFITLSNEEKADIAQVIVREDGNGDNLYWMEIVLSSAIATFGLLQNSVAIIIGAMLIAPLLQPMKAIAFAIATGRSSFFWKAMLFLFKSVLLSIVVAAFLLWISPIQVPTTEINARTNPNILDLFVAIFSAMVAFFSLAYKQLSESVAGVAMAASLMPPLSVAGIEAALGNWELAWGGFFLFFVNFLSILIVGVVIFIMYGFTPHEEMKKKVSSRKIFTLITIILLTTYPLYSSISTISQKIITQEKAQHFLADHVQDTIKGADLVNLSVLSIGKKEIKLLGSMRVPENIEVYEESYRILTDGLKAQFGKDIDLQLEMVRTANFATKDAPVDRKSILRSLIRKQFLENFSHFSLIQIESQKITEENSPVWIARITVSLPSGKYISDEEKTNFQKTLEESFIRDNEQIRLIWVPIAQAPEEKKLSDPIPTAEEKFQEQIKLEWEHFFATPFFKNIEVQNLQIYWTTQDDTKPFSNDNIKEVVVKAKIFHPTSQRKKGILNHIQVFSKKLTHEKVSLQFGFIAVDEEKMLVETIKDIPEKIEVKDPDQKTSQ